MFYLFAFFQIMALAGALATMKFGVITEGKGFEQIQLEYIKKVK